MCIRDRREHVGRQAEAAADGFGGLAAGLGADGVEVDEPGCLLYTSDAADERSSVDLGGRRIIKKKIR